MLDHYFKPNLTEVVSENSGYAIGSRQEPQTTYLSQTRENLRNREKAVVLTCTVLARVLGQFSDMLKVPSGDSAQANAA